MTQRSDELGLVLYRCRLEHGLSLRTLARKLGLSAHSSLVDFEKGRRLPPEYLLAGYERIFGLPAQSLVRIRLRLLARRADVLVRQRLAAEPAESAEPAVAGTWSASGR